MASSNDNVSMALFCDFENVALGVRDANYDKFDIKPVLERLLLKGNIVVKKAYCDWDRYKAFKAPMHEANFELIEIPHVRQSGKNSADIRMVVDALDMCYTKSHVDTFVIISGDSDFSPLVSKLRENAKKVIGVGVKQSTSDLLVANCDEFIFYDDLVRESRRAAKRDSPEAKPAVKRSPEEERGRREEMEKRRNQAVEIAVNTFEALVAERGDSGKIWASVLKEAIKRRKPDFSESYYGFRTFGNLIEEAKARGLLEFGRDEKSGAYVYRSSGAAAAGVSSASESSSSMVDGLPGDVDGNKLDSKPDGNHEGKQESRRGRGRGRSAAERFAERQAERLAQQGRTDQDGESESESELNSNSNSDTEMDNAGAVAKRPWYEAETEAESETETELEPQVQAQPSNGDRDRERGRGRGNRGGRKQGERGQGERQGERQNGRGAAAPVVQAALELPVEVAPVVVSEPQALDTASADAATPGKKKNGPKPPARKLKAAAKTKDADVAPATGGRNAKPAYEVNAAHEVNTANEVNTVNAAKPAKPAKPASAAKPTNAAKPAKPAKGSAGRVAAAPADIQPAAPVADAAPAAAKPAKAKAARPAKAKAAATTGDVATPAAAPVDTAVAKPARKPSRGAKAAAKSEE